MVKEDIQRRTNSIQHKGNNIKQDRDMKNKHKEINFDKLITQDRIMPYYNTTDIEENDEQLYEATLNTLEKIVNQKQLSPRCVIETINLLKFSVIHNALQTKLEYDDEHEREMWK